MQTRFEVFEGQLTRLEARVHRCASLLHLAGRMHSGWTGRTLQRIRKSRRLSQSQLAESMNAFNGPFGGRVHQTDVCNWEHGRLPGLVRMRQAASVLAVDIGDLFDA